MAGKPARAEQLFGEMQQKSNHFSTHVEPTAVTYKHLMAAHSPGADHVVGDPAWETDVVGEHIVGDATDASAHVGGAAGGGNPARVLGLFAEMRSRGLVPTAAHWHLALRACCVHAELPLALGRIERLYEEMRGAGARLDTRTLLAMLEVGPAHEMITAQLHANWRLLAADHIL